MSVIVSVPVLFKFDQDALKLPACHASACDSGLLLLPVLLLFELVPCSV